MNKFINYVIKQNSDKIEDKVIDTITHNKDFVDSLVENARLFLAHKLNTASEDEDLDIVIEAALNSDEFVKAIIPQNFRITKISNPTVPDKPEPVKRVVRPAKSGFKMMDVANAFPFEIEKGDPDYDMFIKNLRLFKKAPGNKDRVTFVKQDLARLITGNVPRIVEKAVKNGVFTTNGLEYKLNEARLEEI